MAYEVETTVQVCTGGQSSLDRLKVVGTSVLLSSSSKSYTNALRIGRNISLAGALNGLNTALYTPCPYGDTNLTSCSRHCRFVFGCRQWHKAAQVRSQRRALPGAFVLLFDPCFWSLANLAAACLFAPL